MSFRSAALLALLLAAPLALAHGEPAEASYDPLDLSFHGWLAQGALVGAAPEAAALAFPTETAPATAGALSFGYDVPVRFSPGGGFDVALRLRADKPVLARDADGNAIEVRVLADGQAIEGAARRVPFDKLALAPGDIVDVRVLLQAPNVTLAEGAELELDVRPLVPLAEGALALLVGPDGSRFDIPSMRVPNAADLRLQDAPLAELVIGREEFRPARADAAVLDVEVGHEAMRLARTAAFDSNGTFVVLRGVEADADARAHAALARDARVAAAHEVRVGSVLARVHPGLAVVVPVPQAPATIECVRNCPPGGFRATIEATGAPAEEKRPSSVLVPPPRDTRGIPVSSDEDASPKETPAGALAFLVLAIFAAAWWRKAASR